MKNGLLQLLSVIPISTLPGQVVPADVAPPPGAVLALSLGVLLTLGVIVVVVVVGAILVIRAIRKSHTHKDEA